MLNQIIEKDATEDLDIMNIMKEPCSKSETEKSH